MELPQLSIENGTDLEQMAKAYGVSDLGEIVALREVNPSEQEEAIEVCMSSNGWNLTTDEYGEEGYDFLAGQEKQFGRDYVTCFGQYPLKKIYNEPLNAKQYGRLYDHWVKITIPCMEEFGYEVGTLPERSTYISSSLDGSSTYSINEESYEKLLEDVQDGKWSSSDEFYTEICPLDPSDEVLFAP